jgi:hypothetical protein
MLLRASSIALMFTELESQMPISQFHNGELAVIALAALYAVVAVWTIL